MSDKYLDTDRMADLIGNDYRLLQVISRFGISLGFGEKTVGETCQQQHVDTNTFLAVTNVTRWGEKSADFWVEKVSVASLTDYLRQTHTYFPSFLLPSVRRKLIEAIDCSVTGNISYLIMKFYDEYVEEVRTHMEEENSKVFPYIDHLLEGRVDEQMPIDMDLLHKAPIEQKLHELKNIIIKYAGNSCDCNLLNAALYEIFQCEEDLFAHCQVEKLLFLPAVHLLEEEKADEAVENVEPNAIGSPGDLLSQREKEIVVSVVKGLTNKEIADHLFISINTVTTHRRNIARKLDIHSAAGLTIYAILNKFVDMSDIATSQNATMPDETPPH